ncbi:MAG: prolyl oligopeptidase family serine peptidase [Pirellulaceae bacterium]
MTILKRCSLLFLSNACLLAMAGLSAMTTSAFADETDAFQRRVYRDKDGGELPYRLLAPREYDAARQYPLVLFLHGAGERGADNQKQLIHGMGDFLRDEIRGKYPCFVVAPQCPQNKQWVAVPWSADEHTMPKTPSTPLRQAVELVDALTKEFSIDEDRLYVTGLSMGGFGAWDAVQRHPQKFAAAAPVCGGGDAALAKTIAGVPIWAFHGDQDNAVKVKRSRDMIEALKKAGGSPRYTEYPGVGHNSWAVTYRNPELYAWLFAQRRGQADEK